MKSFLVILLAVILGGCGRTVNEMRAEGPRAIYTSAKSAEEVSKCILFSWQDLSWYGNHFDVFLQPGVTGGFTVLANFNSAVADVVSSGESTRVDYYQAGRDGRLNQDFHSRVKSCM